MTVEVSEWISNLTLLGIWLLIQAGIKLYRVSKRGHWREPLLLKMPNTLCFILVLFQVHD